MKCIKVCPNILLVQLGDIGDVVLSIPAFRAVRECFPQAKVIVAVREKARDLFPHIPWVDDVLAVNQEYRPLLSEICHQRAFFSLIRSFHFDLAFDFRMGTRGAIMAFLSGAKERIGFFDPDGFWRNRLFTSLYRLDYQPSQYVAAYYFSLLQAYGLTVAHSEPEMIVHPKMEKFAARILCGEGISCERPLVAIQPFSLWRYKEWSVDKYLLLMQRILSSSCVSIVVTGSRDEYERAEGLVARCRDLGLSVFNLAGKTSLGELAAVVKLCRLFIGSDSAGIHIAAAVGTPTITLFGPSAPSSWAPKGDWHTIVQKKLPCIPCRRKGCDDSEVSRCLDDLDVDEVWGVVEPRLKALGFPSV
jgi:lipopolysaccharide heptosyltransferase II